MLVNYYRILGVKDFSSIDDVKIAYKKLSKKFHPDINDGDKFFEEKFKELQEAYENLSDPITKSQFDGLLKDFYFQHDRSENKSSSQKENTNEKDDFKSHYPRSESSPSETRTERKATIKSNFNKVVIFLILFIILGTIMFKIFDKSKIVEKSNPKGLIADSTTVTPDTTTVWPLSDHRSQHDSLKAENCTEDNALLQFNSYMKFYYPDWKIFGKPVLRETSDCVYQIRFTTVDPHIKILNEKEVIVVEIRFSYDFNNYYFEPLRGRLY